MQQTLSINHIKELYPDEWVLIGDPVMDSDKLDVVSGVPVYHSKDKKEVCYVGREKTSDFQKVTLIYTGTFHSGRKLTGIFNRVPK